MKSPKEGEEALRGEIVAMKDLNEGTAAELRRKAAAAAQSAKPTSGSAKAAPGSAKASAAPTSASSSIDAKIMQLGDWRGTMLAKVRDIVHQADPEIVEEWKWVKPTSPGVPVWSHGGIVCTGETYKNAVKMTFAKGASLPDPAGLFNSSLEGNVRRAIDIHEGDKIDAAALKQLIRAAVALNLEKAKKSALATRKTGSGLTRREPGAGKSKPRSKSKPSARS